MRSRRYTTRPRATNETPDLAANVATKEEILGMALLPEAHGAMRDESKPDTSFGSGSEKRKRLKEKGGGVAVFAAATHTIVHSRQTKPRVKER